jgi:hypothetical protein
MIAEVGGASERGAFLDLLHARVVLSGTRGARDTGCAAPLRERAQ